MVIKPMYVAMVLDTAMAKLTRSGAVYRAFGGPTTARPTTDFFTSNPSLLHHLPRNPKLAIVQTGQAPTAGVENGAASGSSRQGWGAGSGGGYTVSRKLCKPER